MKKILLLTSDFYPFAGACSNISNSIANALINYGYHVDVVKACKSDASFSPLSIKSFSRSKTSDYLRVRDKIRVIIEKTIIHLQKKTKTYYFNWFDYHSFFRLLKKIKAKEYDYIFSISGLFCNTFAAVDYCRKNRVNLIVYQVDPFLDNITFSNITRKKREKWAKKISEDAFLLISPNYVSELKTLQKDNLIHLELPLVSASQMCPIGSNNKNELKCIFVGSLSNSMRNPDYAIRLFERLATEIHGLSVSFIGVDKEQVNSSFINCVGKLPLKVAKDEMQKCDFLINIGNSTTTQTPSKLFDYISTGKPIINFCKSKSCPTINYLSKYVNKINVMEDDVFFESNCKLVKAFLLEHHGLEEDVPQKYKEFTADYFVRELSKYLS